MKKNIWEIIANQYGIPLEREFTIDELAQSPVYKFTKNGIVRVGCSLPTSPDISLHILSGEVSITPKPWKPKVGDRYWIATESIEGKLYAEVFTWNNDITDYCAYRCGNCFMSKEEAEAQMCELRYTLGKYYIEKEV